MGEVNPFIENPCEFLTLKALVEVKTKRMSEDVAIKEAISQRYKQEMTIDYLSDLYIAAELLYKRYDWFKKGAKAMVLALQRRK